MPFPFSFPSSNSRNPTSKMADNFVDVAKQFCDFYYQTFDADRNQLGPLYRDQSMLTYESSSVQGVAAIVEKLAVSPFQDVAC